MRLFQGVSEADDLSWVTDVMAELEKMQAVEIDMTFDDIGGSSMQGGSSHSLAHSNQDETNLEVRNINTIQSPSLN